MFFFFYSLQFGLCFINFFRFYKFFYFLNIHLFTSWLLFFTKLKRTFVFNKIKKNLPTFKKNFFYKFTLKSKRSSSFFTLNQNLIKKFIFFYNFLIYSTILLNISIFFFLICLFVSIVFFFYLFKFLKRKFNFFEFVKIRVKKFFFYVWLIKFKRRYRRRRHWKRKFKKRFRRFFIRMRRLKKKKLRQKLNKSFKFRTLFSFNVKNMFSFSIYLNLYCWARLLFFSNLIKLFKRRRRWKKKIFRRLRKNLKLQKNTKFLLGTNSVKPIIRTFLINNQSLNIYYPLIFTKWFNIKFFFLQQTTIYLNFIKFLSIFVLYFLENLFLNRFFIFFQFFKNKKVIKVLRRHIRKVFSYQFKIGSGFFLKEMFYIIWLAFKIKDLLFLVLWIKRTMERIRWRKHKIFLLALRLVLRKCISPYFYYLKCYGYRCVLWGKIGVAGNSKTRNFVCKNKSYSLTTKKYKTSYEFTTINTFTGVLGLSFYLVF